MDSASPAIAHFQGLLETWPRTLRRRNAIFGSLSPNFRIANLNDNRLGDFWVWDTTPFDNKENSSHLSNLPSPTQRSETEENSAETGYAAESEDEQDSPSPPDPVDQATSLSFSVQYEPFSTTDPDALEEEVTESLDVVPYQANDAGGDACLTVPDEAPETGHSDVRDTNETPEERASGSGAGEVRPQYREPGSYSEPEGMQSNRWHDSFHSNNVH